MTTFLYGVKTVCQNSSMYLQPTITESIWPSLKTAHQLQNGTMYLLKKILKHKNMSYQPTSICNVYMETLS